MFKKVLIANRGEIAVRIIKTLNRMGIGSVAIYSEADRFSPHVKMATEAYCVGPAAPLESYLNIAKIIEVAQKSNACAIHPGYGFLSENPEFAEICEQLHIQFIGPGSQAMRDVGSKQRAKQMLEHTQVPLIPGFNPPNPSDDALTQAAHQIGFPVVLKATHGGGGKGLKIVYHAKDFQHAMTSARREAKSYFNNDELLLEKLIEHPRHLEVQVLGDNHGHIIHLFERDCSVQRRQQKIIEEAPAIKLSAKTRQKLYQYALDVAKTFSYNNAGTVEFLLVGEDTLYFMEMNARLQVEHPITEMITGLDLVEWQIRIASGEKLSIEQPLAPNGHAIECRICAEQPQHDFRPSQGQIKMLQWPQTSKTKRIDTGIENHQLIESHYDSLLAKAICWQPDRTQAARLMQHMLDETQILGIETNVAYLNTLLENPRWLKGAVLIDFLSQYESPPAEKLSLSAIVVMDSIHFWSKKQAIPLDLCNMSITGPQFSPRSVSIDDEEIHFCVSYHHPGKVAFKTDSEIQVINYQYQAPWVYIDNGQNLQHYKVEFKNSEWLICDQQQQYRIETKMKQRLHSLANQTPDGIISPMPATIVAIFKRNGDIMIEGEPLMVLEAMKMEHTIYAPFSGTIKQLFYTIGQQVQEGQQLLELTEKSDS